MNPRSVQILAECDNRYPTAEEEREIAEFARSVPKRLEVARLVEKAEQDAVRHCIDEVKKRYPGFSNHHDFAWGKAFRDVQLTLRTNVQAMLLGDMRLLDEKLLFWLKTILASFAFTPKFNRDTYTFLRDGLKQRLPADAFALIEPYLERNISVLSDFPEPAVPAV